MTPRILLATAIGLITSLAAVPAVADALDDIVARKTIRVAVPTDYPPFGSVGADMQPRGMDIDIAN